MTRLRLTLVHVVEYEPDPARYGTDDPWKMAAFDQAAVEANPDSIYTFAGTVDVTVEVIG